MLVASMLSLLARPDQADAVVSTSCQGDGFRKALGCGKVDPKGDISYSTYAGSQDFADAIVSTHSHAQDPGVKGACTVKPAESYLGVVADGDLKYYTDLNVKGMIVNAWIALGDKAVYVCRGQHIPDGPEWHCACFDEIAQPPTLHP